MAPADTNNNVVDLIQLEKTSEDAPPVIEDILALHRAGA